MKTQAILAGICFAGLVVILVVHHIGRRRRKPGPDVGLALIVEDPTEDDEPAAVTQAIDAYAKLWIQRVDWALEDLRRNDVPAAKNGLLDLRNAVTKATAGGGK